MSPRLVVDFAGETHEPDPDGVFVIGRTGDLEIDDNPYLHRTFLEIAFADGLWWVTNVGGRLAAHLTDRKGLLRTTLSPGARQPLVFPETSLTFTAGSTTYEVLLTAEVSTVEPAHFTDLDGGDTTITHAALTESQKLAVLALAEPQLKRVGTGASQVPPAVEAAARLGWPQTRFNRKLDNICDKLDKAGVAGLRGGPGNSAANRRVTLVEFAVSTLLVTSADLPLLEAESRTNHNNRGGHA